MYKTTGTGDQNYWTVTEQSLPSSGGSNYSINTNIISSFLKLGYWHHFFEGPTYELINHNGAYHALKSKLRLTSMTRSGLSVNLHVQSIFIER